MRDNSSQLFCCSLCFISLINHCLFSFFPSSSDHLSFLLFPKWMLVSFFKIILQSVFSSLFLYQVFIWFSCPQRLMSCAYTFRFCLFHGYHCCAISFCLHRAAILLLLIGLILLLVEVLHNLYSRFRNSCFVSTSSHGLLICSICIRILFVRLFSKPTDFVLDFLIVG